MSTTLSSSPAFDLMIGLMSPDLSDTKRQAAFDDLVSRPVIPQLVADGVRALRSRMIPVDLSAEAIDTCGTGGSGKRTINTSTLSAFIVAAAGGKVAKHGNRSASGNCGCFDLLEALGVRIDLTPEQEAGIFDKLGIVFLFAPLHHPALKFVGPLRKTHGKKTVFNLFGPLCNPAGVRQQMVGTGDPAQAMLMAETLRLLGLAGSIVVRGHDGLDEVTVTGKTDVHQIGPENVKTSMFSPEELGLSLASGADIQGGTVAENAQIFLNILQGKEDGPKRDLVLVNAAQALRLGHPERSIDEAFAMASEALESGKAFELFRRYREISLHIRG